MKTTLCCVITLLTLMGQITLPHSFAQIVDEPHLSVRVIYFLPKDRQSQPDIDTTLDTLVKKVQKFYADEMERHGFGRKTFRLETGENGQAVVHRVKGKFRSSHYDNTIVTVYQRVLPEIRQRFDTSSNTYLVVADLNQSRGGYAFEGTAFTTTEDFNKLDWQQANDYFVMTAHELGHCFGLHHDFRSDAYIMSYGPRPDRLSKCAAGVLDVNSYFNVPSSRVQINTDPTMQMLPPILASPNAIRLRFEANDPKSLLQVQLSIPVTPGDPAPGFKLEGCHLFENDSNTIEFVSTDLIHSPQNEVKLRVIDRSGRVTSQTFPIDISNILPPSKIMSIPDPNLAASIREALGLGKDDPIFQRALLSFKGFNARDRQIKNLSGLEHMTQLRYLYLGRGDAIHDNDNNVSDLTPLKNLRLNQLWLGGNNVSDITPLKNLTELVDLDLFDNNVSDITPLKNLPQLEKLRLGRNPFSDLTPLKNLTELVSLRLYVTNVSDITPLSNMTKLKVLSVSRSNVSDVTSLKNLTELEHLSLDDNNVSDIAVLANLPQLKRLYLDSNKVSDLTPLKNLTELRYLYLRSNNVSDITPLINLSKLEVLHLEGNPIKNHSRLLTMLHRNPDIKIYLTEGGDPLPVTLSHFRAELTPAGVILKWATESEVDNAGFHIYRSETKEGTFKVVNPTMIQGAGTTSEKHTYTWTDTTAKPNVAYYYRIEDISHAGVRKQLATVRMRGLVSASGKLTIIWGDLKTLK